MTAPEHLDAREWFRCRTLRHARSSDPAPLLPAAVAAGRAVTVCLAAGKGRGTVGPILRTIPTRLMERVPLVDERAATDAASTDGTVEAALAEGVAVSREAEEAPGEGHLGGKGDARFGLDAIARVELEERAHRDRDVPELSRMAFGVVRGPVTRLSSLGRLTITGGMHHRLVRLAGRPGEHHLERTETPVLERPPALSLRSDAEARTAPPS